jgi:hypothetical protein
MICQYFQIESNDMLIARFNKIILCHYLIIWLLIIEHNFYGLIVYIVGLVEVVLLKLMGYR